MAEQKKHCDTCGTRTDNLYPMITSRGNKTGFVHCRACHEKRVSRETRDEGRARSTHRLNKWF